MPPVWLQHMAEIEKDTAVLRIIVCVFMESDTVCTGQLHINPEIIKTHRIIARRRFLCLLLKVATGLIESPPEKGRIATSPKSPIPYLTGAYG